MSQQFFFLGHAAEVPVDQLVSLPRRSATHPQADQHARDECAVYLRFDAVLRVAQQMTVAKQMF